jgi:hypothetical protein|tara:strand:+ start:5035 stop:5226 length:192 start_codon:yes stop_codon:yes gene_type:complete
MGKVKQVVMEAEEYALEFYDEKERKWTVSKHELIDLVCAKYGSWMEPVAEEVYKELGDMLIPF